MAAVSASGSVTTLCWTLSGGWDHTEAVTRGRPPLTRTSATLMVVLPISKPTTAFKPIRGCLPMSARLSRRLPITGME